MEILYALNAICGILGITAKDIPNILNGKASRKKTKTPLGNILEDTHKIDSLVLIVLIEFLWNGQVSIPLRESSNGGACWQQREYDILGKRLNEKLGSIGYAATVTPYSTGRSVDVDYPAYNAHVDIVKTDRQSVNPWY